MVIRWTAEERETFKSLLAEDVKKEVVHVD